MNMLIWSLSILSFIIAVSPIVPVKEGTIVSLTTTEQERTNIAYNALSRIPTAPEPIYDDTLGVDVTAIAAIVQDVESKAVLWEKNPDEVRSLASITKLATLLVVLDTVSDVSQVVDITRADYTSLGYQTLSVGDRVSILDLIAAAVITSDNTAANALARITGLSRKQFLEAMTEYVRSLGMTQTNFADVNGLLNANVSTAREILILADAAFQVPLIRDLSQRSTYTLIKNGTEHVRIYNTNRLIGSMIDITAGKTGFVTESGYNLVAESVRDGHYLLAVVLGSATNEDRFQDYKMLVYWTWEHFTWHD